MDILQSKLNKVPSQQGDRDPEVIKSPNVSAEGSENPLISICWYKYKIHLEHV